MLRRMSWRQCGWAKACSFETFVCGCGTVPMQLGGENCINQSFQNISDKYFIKDAMIIFNDWLSVTVTDKIIQVNDNYDKLSISDLTPSMCRMTQKWKLVPFLRDTWNQFIWSPSSIIGLIYHSPQNARIFRKYDSCLIIRTIKSTLTWLKLRTLTMTTPDDKQWRHWLRGMLFLCWRF